MMKKKILAILAVLMVFLLAGCIKSAVSVTVNQDGSGTAKIIVGLSKQYQSMLEQQGTSIQDAFKDQSDQYTAQGYTVADYSDDKYIGISLTKDFEDIQDVQAMGLTIVVSDTEPKTIKIDSTVDTSSQMSAQGQDASTLASMGDFEMKFEITLPNAATSNNATSVSGNTYTWDLLQQPNVQLEATLSGGASANWLLIGGIIGGVLIIAIIVIVILLSSRKKKAAMAQGPYAQQYQQPVQPAQPIPTPEPAQPTPEPASEPESAPAPEPGPAEAADETPPSDDTQE